MEAYLDNAATTKVYDSVKDIMEKVLTKDYGNPSSLHSKGFEAELYIKTAREIIGKSLKVDTKEIIFTSGGTESNNLALIGSGFANKRAGNHIITSNIEHASIYNVMSFLEGQGFRISYVPVDEHGRVIIKELEKQVCEDTILVSIMYVNNEIGSVNDIPLISQTIKNKNKNTLFHVDGIQAYGKYNIYPKKEGIDLLSLSGHKIHGPKGVGALYVADKVKINPLMFGGGQEQGIRSGTENVPGIAGLGQAAYDIYDRQNEKEEYLYSIKQLFINKIEELNNKIGGITINGLEEDIKRTAPHIVSVSFEGIRAEVLLHALEERQVYVSSGSACSSNHPDVSGTLKAIGVKEKLLKATLRFSFSYHTRSDEIEYTIIQLEELIPILRKYQAH